MTPTLHFTRFGRYEIIRKLGRSLVDVYLALDPEANRRVVLKIVEQARDPLTQTVLDAERRGAMIQQQLHGLDPRILEIYEYGEQDGCFFVAMQYAEGRSLAEILGREGKLEPRRAAKYAAEVAGQLVALHSFQAEMGGQRRAVVHGDIKPSNLQIGRNDEVWLLDFGIAKSITQTRNLTSHNLGSPGYCSPERIRRGQVDPQADLWALGVSLYEMIAGLPPYQAQSTRKLENLIQSRRPPRALPESCPAALKAVIAKALAGEIERRYASAAAVEADLRAFLDGRPTVAEGERQPSWAANATLEKAPAEDEPERGGWPLQRWIGQFNRFVLGLIIGFVLFIPAAWLFRVWVEGQPLRARRDYLRSSIAEIDADWRLYKNLRQRYSLLGRWSPLERLRPELRAGLTAAGNDVLDRYRNGAGPELADFDWDKARVCFSHALELENTDREARGKLAVAEGYLELVRGDAAEAAGGRFRAAVQDVPSLPDPHLGLARVYVYGLHNAGEAMAEMRTAERLGYRLGPREIEQQGDAYLQRGEREMLAWQRAPAAQARQLPLAQRDFERARNLYEPIAGFSKVDESLDRLYRNEDQIKRIQAELARRHVYRPRWQPRRRR
jgi:hypothetical protein